MTFPRPLDEAVVVFLNITQNSFNCHQISVQECGKNAFHFGVSFANICFRDYRPKKNWKQTIGTVQSSEVIMNFLHF